MLEGEKVVTASEMASVESQCVDAGASRDAYMLEAGRNIAQSARKMIDELSLDKCVDLLIGKGNNGGDAFVCGVELLKDGYQVRAHPLFASSETSPLSQKYSDAFIAAGGGVQPFDSGFDLYEKGLVIDGLLGTGFKGKLQDPFLKCIEQMGRRKQPVLSIDIPSGVEGDFGSVSTCAIKATRTVTLGMPKLGLFLNGGYNFVGDVITAPFGLSPEYVKKAQPAAFLMNEGELSKLLPEVERTRYKYQAGYMLAVAGSEGMPGAALLACKAALHSGVGIMRLFHPKGMEVGSEPLELIREEHTHARILQESKRANALVMGPGAGRSDQTKGMLRQVMQETSVPTVLDADALYLLGSMIESFKQPLILTPHHQEMCRLLNIEEMPHSGTEWIDRCQVFVESTGVICIVKGAPNMIFRPGKQPLISMRGDPGMATAGSGDVLAGVIGALLAQGCELDVAACLGVYLHGLAGEIASRDKTAYCMVASDIVKHLPDAFKSLVEKGV